MSGRTGIYLGTGPDGKMIVYNGDRHLFLIGPNGSGKGQRFIVQNVIFLTGRPLVILDPKAELAAQTIAHRRKLGPVYVFNPHRLLVDEYPELQLESTGFNPFDRLDPKSDSFPDDVAGQAEAIVRHDPRAQQHFSSSARSLLAALIMHEKIENGDKATLDHVREMLTETTQYKIMEDGKKGRPVSGFGRTLTLMAASDYKALRNKAGRFAGEHNDEISSVISTAIDQTDFADSIPIARDLSKGGGFRFRSLMRENATVYLILPAEYLETHSGWMRLIVQSALHDLYGARRGPGRPKPLFIFDELPAALGNLNVLERAMGIARAWFQMCVVVQDLSQMRDLYDKRWETFIGNTGALISFAPRDYGTAEYLSKLTGIKKEPTQQRSRGKTETPQGTTRTDSMNESFRDVPLLRPDELMYLNARHENAGKALLVVHEAEGPIITNLPGSWEMPALKPHLGPNPYFQG